MVTSAKKSSKLAAKPASAVAAPAPSAAAPKRSAPAVANSKATARAIGRRNAPAPTKRLENRFSTDPDSVLRFAIKAGILTPDKKLTPSFG